MGNWSGNAVKEALIEAFAVDRLIGGRVGPKMYGNAMPAYYADDSDLNVIRLQDAVGPEKGGSSGAHWREMQAMRRIEMSKGRVITPQQVSKMEEILLGKGDEPGWLQGLLREEDKHRTYLEAFSVQSAIFGLRGQAFKETSLCRRMKWPYSTYRERRDEGANILSYRLNNRGVSCWIEGIGKPSTDPRDVPLTIVLMEFLKGGPKSKSQFVSFCFDHRVIREKDIRDQSVATAFAKLLAGKKIRRRAADLMYERI